MTIGELGEMFKASTNSMMSHGCSISHFRKEVRQRICCLRAEGYLWA
jgi:hypothetical protein